MIEISKITAYTLSSKLSDKVWFLVSKWPVLAQKTLGEQFIRSTDSVGANIIEEEGRYFKKDKIRFYYQARGSALESIHWLEKARSRKLVIEKVYLELKKEFEGLPKQINYLISNTSKNLKK